MGRGRTITVDGETLTIAQWARRLGVPPVTIYARLHQGWPEEEAVTTPKVRPGSHLVRPITVDGETRTILQWAERLGCDRGVIYARLHQGWPEEEAVTTPVRSSRIGRGDRYGPFEVIRRIGSHRAKRRGIYLVRCIHCDAESEMITQSLAAAERRGQRACVMCRQAS